MKQYRKSLNGYNIFKRISTTDSEKFYYNECYFIENAITFDVLYSTYNYTEFKNYLKTIFGLSIPRGRWARG